MSFKDLNLGSILKIKNAIRSMLNKIYNQINKENQKEEIKKLLNKINFDYFNYFNFIFLE